MASSSSKSSGKQENGAEMATADHDTEARAGSGLNESGEVIVGDTSLTDALFASERAAPDETTAQSEEPAAEPEAAEPAQAAEPTPSPSAPEPSAARDAGRGPGFVPLLIGGVVAAGLGYGAAYMGLLGNGNDNESSEIAQAIQAQSTTLAALQEQVSALSSPNETETSMNVDLSPVLDELANLSQRLETTSETLGAVNERIDALEDRPILTGEGDADSAAMAAAMEILQAELGDQQAANEAIAAEMRTISEEARSAIAEAETRTQETVATAMAEAEESVAAATAQAALTRVQIAMAAGDPFAEALADMPSGVEVPETLSAVAETGVSTLVQLQSGFPAAARAALPIALREVNADAGAGDRALAFLRGQFGGRSIEPREGDDPDAVLSRAQAAVTEGNLEAAIAEIALLPEGAASEMAAWVEAAGNRVAATAALETLATALDSAN